MINEKVEEHENFSPEPQEVTLTMKVTDVHNLLKLIEHEMRFVNIDTIVAVDLWEKISDLLDPTTQHVQFGSPKHRKLEPEVFTEIEAKKKEKIEADKTIEDHWKDISLFGKFINLVTCGWLKRIIAKDLKKNKEENNETS